MVLPRKEDKYKYLVENNPFCSDRNKFNYQGALKLLLKEGMFGISNQKFRSKP
ncbi:MAG: hypothetical protein R6W85_12795 [Gillisia sp.]